MAIRSLPHKVDRDHMQQSFAFCLKNLEEFPSERDEQLKKKNPRFFILCIDSGLDAMNLAYFLGKDLSKVVNYFRGALPEVKVALDLGYEFDGQEFRRLLLSTIAVNHKKAIELLCAIGVDAYRHPDVEMSDCPYAITEAIQAAASGKMKTFKVKIAEAQALLNPKRLIIDRRKEEAEFKPLIALLRAIADKDQAALEEAWKSRAQYWKKEYGKKSESANYDGILDRELLGIARIAEQYGLTAPGSNPYAPIELLRVAEDMK